MWQIRGERKRVSIVMCLDKALTGTTYPYVQYGKPTSDTYKFAEKMLTDHCQELYGVGHLPSV